VKIIRMLTMTILTIGSITALGGALSQPVFAAAASPNPLTETCKAPGAADTALCKSNPTGANNPVGGSTGIIPKIINVVLVAAGVAGVIAILIGGFEYAMSNGDSSKINTAKSTILYAVIGLIVAITAEVILKFVVKRI
jgi:hypothetical protein